MPDLSLEARNALADTLRTRLYGGVTVFRDAGGVDLFTLPNLAFDAAAGGVISATGLPADAPVTATGIASSYELRDSTGAWVLRGPVSAPDGGGEAIMPNPTVTNGEEARVTSITLTVPASNVVVG
ncbi:hypothetical protein [Falsirhodobacter halotolerans]|uniref:hypothetical protein n=1 Tax=Falsirhodobacter halotolerans TaxID=1146892 RepID=UPI001FD620C5|nr:hypothetical protein [Falsirhodobacter halotolerans]MCJ8139344.1 hypothetical protein [Falsirhodobacter halotolerans]